MRHKLTIGQSDSFVWSPPASGVYATIGTATLSIYFASQTRTYTLTQRADDAITAISSDRKRLTVTWGSDGAISTLADMPAPVFIVGGAESQVPANVLRVVSSGTLSGTFELADPLPVAVNTGAALRWQMMRATVSSAHLPASPVRAVKYTVSMTADRFGQSADVLDRGVLSVVRAAFATGLTDATLKQVAPWTASHLPPGQSSWDGIIASTALDLESRIDRALPSGSYADDVAGAQFRRAHELLTIVAICDEMAGRGIDRSALRERAVADFAEEFRAIMGALDWLDLDGDGAVSAGETGQAAYPGVAALSHVGDATVIDLDDVATPDVYTRSRVTDDR